MVDLPVNHNLYLPLCSSGWLTHWGESMANTSSSVLAADTQVLLRWARNTTSLSFYMVHGGSNFGFNQGANVDGSNYQPHITSYDYDAPISEAGDYCQPGIGGECKYHVSGLGPAGMHTRSMSPGRRECCRESLPCGDCAFCTQPTPTARLLPAQGTASMLPLPFRRQSERSLRSTRGSPRLPFRPDLASTRTARCIWTGRLHSLTSCPSSVSL